MDKPKVIFIHILKCGGTSMLHMLYEQYGVEYFHPVPISTVKNIVSYPSLRGVTALTWQQCINVQTAHHYGCIAGHYDWRIAERLTQFDVLVMLRNPVDQLRSLYQYMARSFAELGDEAVWMESVGFDGWVRSGHCEPYLNALTTYLSGHHAKNEQTAYKNLFGGRVIYGLVERYNESIEIFNRRFDWTLRPLHLHKSENVVTMADETRRLVEELQVKDMALYREAVARFGEQ